MKNLSDRVTVGVILPGRRRLMREEDSEESASEEDEERGGLFTGPSRECPLLDLGIKRSKPNGGLENSSGFSKKTCTASSSPVPATSGSSVTTGSDVVHSSPDVIYIKTEGTVLSQTLLTSWLVKKSVR